MFEYIKGHLADKYTTSVGFYFVIDVEGIGYRVEVSEKEFNSDINIDSEIKMYTKLIHKEDTMSLCGFSKRESRDIFVYLTSVSGVGVKMALALLGCFDTADLVSIVINEEYKQLTLAKGVGPKLAQKIILELRDKLIKSNITLIPDTLSGVELTPACKETTSILLSLGYTDEEINTALNFILGKCANKNDSEELLRESLKYLSM